MAKKQQSYFKGNNRPQKIANNKSKIRASIRQENLIFKNNMQALYKHYPEVASVIEKTALNDKYELVPTGEGNYFNLREKKSELLYYNSANPWEDVKNQMDALKLRNTRLALFLGNGLGYELNYYMLNLSIAQNTSHILVIEKDPEIFKAALMVNDLVEAIQHPLIRFMVGEDEKRLYTTFRAYLSENYRFLLLKAVKPVYHSSSIRFYKDYYINTIKILRDAGADQVAYYGNDPYDSLIGIENMLSNLDEIVFNPGINLLFDKFKNKPAIVVSTGPSLNKNKHLLKGLEDKALIIAADASLKVLRAMDFKPHLVATLERGIGMVKLFEGFSPEEVSDVYLAACPVVVNEVYQAYPGPRIVVYRSFDHFKWLNIDRGIVNIQLSSGNMAFKLATVLGCDPIILIGQDLAFSRDGRSHAADNYYGEKVGDHYNMKTMEVMGNDGSPILTNQSWQNLRKAYEVDLAEYKGRCINSTEGGAYILGTEVMPFQDSINKYINEEFYPLKIIKDSLSAFDAKESEQDRQRVLDLIETTIADMEYIMENCREGVAACEKYKNELLWGVKDENNLQNLSASLEDIEKEVSGYKANCLARSNTFQLLLMHVVQSVNIKFEMGTIALPDKYPNTGQAKAATILRQIEWYALIHDIVSICMQKLMGARDHMLIGIK